MCWKFANKKDDLSLCELFFWQPTRRFISVTERNLLKSHKTVLLFSICILIWAAGLTPSRSCFVNRFQNAILKHAWPQSSKVTFFFFPQKNFYFMDFATLKLWILYLDSHEGCKNKPPLQFGWL